MKLKTVSILIAAIITANFSFGATIHVVTTTQDTKSITEIIGGKTVSVFAIATGYQNPHFV